MKKKTIIIISASIICIILVVFIGNNVLINNRVEEDNIEIKFFYDDSKTWEKVDSSDGRAIAKILSGYKLKEVDIPSCGFTDDIAIYINNRKNVFCLACDGCPIIYWKNKNTYFRLSEKDNRQLHSVLKKYGMKFPCI